MGFYVKNVANKIMGFMPMKRKVAILIVNIYAPIEVAEQNEKGTFKFVKEYQIPDHYQIPLRWQPYR